MCLWHARTVPVCLVLRLFFFCPFSFFFNVPATSEIYTLSLHDALPILRYECGHAVVIAEANLVSGDRVIFVHDRHDAELEQARERAVGVAVAFAPNNVIDGEQRLPNRDAAPSEGGRIPGDQKGLAAARGRWRGGDA